MQKLEDNISFRKGNRIRNKREQGGIRIEEERMDRIADTAVHMQCVFAVLRRGNRRLAPGKQERFADGGKHRRDSV